MAPSLRYLSLSFTHTKTTTMNSLVDLRRSAARTPAAGALGARAPNRRSRTGADGAPSPSPAPLLLLRPPSLFLLRQRSPPRTAAAATPTGKGGGAGESSGLGFKAAWVAAEVLGDVIGGGKGKGKGEGEGAAHSSSSAPMTRDQIIASIRDDFAANYFLTGQGDMLAYDPDCLYADPFSSFRGTARFKKNVANFGAVVDAVRVDLGELGPDPRDTENSVVATWKFSGVVKVLPWRPVLAASGATRHVIDRERGLVVQHIEEWASSPGEVLERLWEPSNRGVPVNRWEAAFGALAKAKRQGESGGLAAALKAAVEWRAPEAVE